MTTRPRLFVFAAIILALSVLPFAGTLDDFADEPRTDTMIETIGIYRTINSGVSVLQSPDVGVEIRLSASLGPGETLDPSNDAAERLCGRPVWAIGSLFLQQIVLEAAASSVFKWPFGGAG